MKVFTLTIFIYLLVFGAVIANAGGAEQAMNEIENNFDDEQQVREILDDLDERCAIASNFDLSVVETKFGLLQANGKIKWLKVHSSDEEILAAGYKIEKRTVVIIHGYMQQHDSPWVKASRDLIVQNGHAGEDNYFYMEWASKVTYFKAASHVRSIGFELAKFLKRLIKLGADRMTMHLIGYSLGGHIAGFAGKNISPKIGRITGIDVAGPCFGRWQKYKGADTRLNQTDAYQVDVSHYDDGVLGIPGRTGQFDIFVNGGQRQPGCPGSLAIALRAFGIMILNLKVSYSPSHERGTLVASSQLSDIICQNVAYECVNYKRFKRGECGQCGKDNNDCFLMDFPFQYKEKLPAQPLRHASGRNFYIRVGKKAPFCINHYQILIEFEPNEDIIDTAGASKGPFKLILQYEGGNYVMRVKNRMKDNVFSHLFLTNLPPKRIIAAQLRVPIKWSKAALSCFKGRGRLEKTSFPVKSIQINYMSHIDPERRLEFSSVLCPFELVMGNKVGSQKTAISFRPC